MSTRCAARCVISSDHRDIPAASNSTPEYTVAAAAVGAVHSAVLRATSAARDAPAPRTLRALRWPDTLTSASPTRRRAGASSGWLRLLRSSGAPASGAPSGPPPSGQPGQVTVQLAAQNIAFDKTELTAPPQQNFTIEFHNNDAGIPHNVEIKDSGGASLFQGEIFNGVDTRLYAVPALNAGDYTFVCTVHPNMTGALSVE